MFKYQQYLNKVSKFNNVEWTIKLAVMEKNVYIIYCSQITVKHKHLPDKVLTRPITPRPRTVLTDPLLIILQCRSRNRTVVSIRFSILMQ